MLFYAFEHLNFATSHSNVLNQPFHSYRVMPSHLGNNGFDHFGFDCTLIGKKLYREKKLAKCLEFTVDDYAGINIHKQKKP